MYVGLDWPWLKDKGDTNDIWKMTVKYLEDPNVDDVIASQFSIYFLYRNGKNFIFQLLEC